MYKYLLIFLIFLGCEKPHECKICEKVFVTLENNEVIRTDTFEACDDQLRAVENQVIKAVDNEGKTCIGIITCRNGL